MPDLAPPSGAALVVVRRSSGAVVGVASVYVTRARLLDRGRLREAPHPLDVVAGDRRGGRRRVSASCLRTRSASATTTSSTSSPVSSPGKAMVVPVRGEVRLVVDLARERNIGRNARAALHDRRRPRVGARRSYCREWRPEPGSTCAWPRSSGWRRSSRARRARSSRRCLRVRDDTPADGAAAAPRRVHGGVPRLLPAHANTIMTEKIARRGERVLTDYAARPVRADPRLGHRAGSGRRR